MPLVAPIKRRLWAGLSLLVLATCGAVIAAASPALAQSPQDPAPPEAAPANPSVLGDKQTTLWAHAETRSWVRTEANDDAQRIVRLRYDTEDGLPEIYVALQTFTDAAGGVWVKVRLPMRPNGTRGWVRREALGVFQRVHTKLVISRARLTARLYRRGRLIWSARVGVGKRATPTPRGRFYIRERFRPSRPDTIYGTLAFGTSAYSRISDWPGGGVVGIHGTNRPGLIPGRPSHGCIRLRNRDVERLGRLMPLGTPVTIT